MSDSCCQHQSHDHGPEPEQAAAFGVANPRGLDALAFDKEAGDIVLIMVEQRPWDGSEERIFQLQEKVNAYLSFALDGELFDTFPQLTGKPVRLQLDCAVLPDPSVEQFVTAVREHIALQDMKFAVRVVGEPIPEGEPVPAGAVQGGGCGTGCGCHP
ncbi:MAG: DUF6572 domain-containing protein [Chthoniobacteraceae bacterium]